MHTTTSQGRRRDLIRSDSSVHDVDALCAFLTGRGTFGFPVLPTGLFPAARLAAGNEYTGYDNVWVRDNVHIAHAHAVTGRPDVAARTVDALARFYRAYAHRFRAVIAGDADPADPMNRPHVRFNGCTLRENPEKWSHAQNDALGYFLWLACRLAREGHLEMRPEHWDLLGLFPPYFQAIRYWRDEDSGHWEEARKISASSIGTVVAGLRELRALTADHGLDALIARGTEALAEILPSECVQPDPAKRRRYDAALLFLIHPLQVVSAAQADQILHDVETHLLGEYGVRRYRGDSFWCADYKSLRAPEARTADVSDAMTSRDALLRPGEEAQWCLFDPLLSTIYGRRYRDTGHQDDLARQVHHLNRSLDQLTEGDAGFPPYLCPELYYLEDGRRRVNDVTPLLWTQANLRVALEQMRQSARRASGEFEAGKFGV